MKTQFKPMLAATITEENLDNLEYPVYISPKIDGIRCVILEGRALSRTLKPIPNQFIRHTLENMMKVFPYLIDGELVVGENFQDVSSGIMSEDGEPNFHYIVFDCLIENNSALYYNRLSNIDYCIPSHKNIRIIDYHKAYNKDDVLTAEHDYLNLGYEGIIIRSQDSSYKFGRSTMREGALLKLKRFVDAEAKILNIVELEHNINEQELDERGYSKRSTKQDGKVLSNKMGALIVRGINGEFENVIFNIGSGFNDSQRIDIWNNPECYIGLTVTYKYQKIGSKDKPRCPIFRCFRKDL